MDSIFGRFVLEGRLEGYECRSKCLICLERVVWMVLEGEKDCLNGPGWLWMGGSVVWKVLEGYGYRRGLSGELWKVMEGRKCLEGFGRLWMKERVVWKVMEDYERRKRMFGRVWK